MSSKLPETEMEKQKKNTIFTYGNSECFCNTKLLQSKLEESFTISENSASLCILGFVGPKSYAKDVHLMICEMISELSAEEEDSGSIDLDDVHSGSIMIFNPVILNTSKREMIVLHLIMFLWDDGLEKFDDFYPDRCMTGLAFSTCTHVLIFDQDQVGPNQHFPLKRISESLKIKAKMERPFGSKGGISSLESKIQQFEDKDVLHKNNFYEWDCYRLKPKDPKLLTWLIDLLDPDNLIDAKELITSRNKETALDTIIDAYNSFHKLLRNYFTVDEEGFEALESYEMTTATSLAECVLDLLPLQQDIVYNLINESYTDYIKLVDDNLKFGRASSIQTCHDEYSQVCLTNFIVRCENEKYLKGYDLNKQEEILKKHIESYRNYTMYDGVDYSYSKDVKKLLNKGMSYWQSVKSKVQEEYYVPLEIPDTLPQFEVFAWKFASKNGDHLLKTHPAIYTAQSSAEKQLSMNSAYILLLGVTGQGKSSTVNFLFDKNCCPVGTGVALTTDVVEFIAPIRKSRLFIKNMELGIIDGPGFGDTQGRDKMHLSTYRNFLDTHLQLRNGKRPNIVMIVHNITDTRIGGKDDLNTAFVWMLRKINGGLKKKIFEASMQNVVFVLTHLESVPESDVKKVLHDMTTSIKLLARNVLGIDDAKVVAVENYPKKYPGRVHRDNYGWYHLSNQEKHPLQLFTTLIEMCEKNEDAIGKEAISKYFSQVGKPNDIRKGHESKGDSDETCEIDNDYLNTIENINQIQSRLEKYFDQLAEDQKRLLGAGVAESVAQFLTNKGINKFQDLRHEDLFKVLRGYPKHSDELVEYVAVALGVEVASKALDIKVGCAYDVFRDEGTGPLVYNLGELGYKPGCKADFPKYVDVFEDAKTFSKSDEFDSTEKYVSNRLLDLNVNFSFPVKTAAMKIRNGYNVSRSASTESKDREKTILIEKQVYKLQVCDESPLSDVFKRDLQQLPHSFDENDAQNMGCWDTFFRRYGTHVIKTAWAGGSCTLTAKSSGTAFTSAELSTIMVELEMKLGGVSASTGYKSSSSSETSKKTLQTTSTVQMEGGDPSFHCVSLHQMEPEIMKSWMQSIAAHPTILTTKMILEPISSVVNTHRNEITAAYENAFRYIYGTNSNTTQRPEYLNSTSRKDATKRTAPGFFRNGWRNFISWVGGLFSSQSYEALTFSPPSTPYRRNF